MSSQEELQSLLTQPRETLSVEYKSWLNLGNNEDKARLAKAAIALANHGGGYIIIGLTEENLTLKPQPKPQRILTITQDLVNGAINRFAEPSFQCDVRNTPHPDTKELYPIIIIPDGQTEPVMSKKGCAKIIQSNHCYIRKPGPKSEEPTTSTEWRELLDRCVIARKEEMLNAFRTIIEGNMDIQVMKSGFIDTQMTESCEKDNLGEFVSTTRSYWENSIEEKRPNSPAQFPNGYYEIAFSFGDIEKVGSLTSLRSQLDKAGQIHHTGWPVFPMLPVAGWEPQAKGKFIEVHLGLPNDENEQVEEAHHCNFWRASLDGELYSICGYREDSQLGSDRILYNSSLIWRLGEGILFANRYIKTFSNVEQVTIYCRFTGLNKRRIEDEAIMSLLRPHICSTDEFIIHDQFKPEEIENNLPEVVHLLLKPLYEQFNFYELSVEFVAAELRKMRHSTFH